MKIGDKVFVYGTLMSGQHNHKWALGAPSLGPAMAAGFVMYHLGGFPGINKGAGEIHGEVLEITSLNQAESMDRLEGHPSFYKREKCFTSKGEAWIYVLQQDMSDRQDRRIITGNWLKAA